MSKIDEYFTDVESALNYLKNNEGKCIVLDERVSNKLMSNKQKILNKINRKRYFNKLIEGLE